MTPRRSSLSSLLPLLCTLALACAGDDSSSSDPTDSSSSTTGSDGATSTTNSSVSTSLTATGTATTDSTTKTTSAGSTTDDTTTGESTTDSTVSTTADTTEGTTDDTTGGFEENGCPEACEAVIVCVPDYPLDECIGECEADFEGSQSLECMEAKAELNLCYALLTCDEILKEEWGDCTELFANVDALCR